MAKATKVVLVNPHNGEPREFEADHAERILNLRNCAWKLPEDSEYEFKDGTLNRRNKKADK